MPIDKTNRNALNQLVEQYKDEIIEYKYKYWRESHQAPPPPKSFAQGMTRYRMCYKVEYIKLKDGRRVKVGGLTHGVEFNEQIGCAIFFIFVGLLVLILIIIF